MELHSPSTPPGNHFTRLPSFNFGFKSEPELNHLSEIKEDADNESDDDKIVHVAVGKSTEKSYQLLQWTFRKFENREIGLVHVHQPSPTIPTLLGKLPASHANEKMVIGYRREEKEQCNKLLSSYLNICSEAKVKTTVFTVDSENVQKGILELVNKQSITRLVLGAVPDNFVKVKKSAPAMCEIWFVNKGNHVWTRKAFENLNMFVPTPSDVRHTQGERLRSKSSHVNKSERIVKPTIFRFNSYPSCAGVRNWAEEDPHQLGVAFSGNGSTSMLGISQSKFGEERYCNEITEARTEAETWRNEAFAELLKCKMFEFEALEATDKVKVFESAHARGSQLRKEVEERLRIVQQEQDQLVVQKTDVSRELEEIIKSVATLNSCVNDRISLRNEAMQRMELIQTSLKTLQYEKDDMYRQKEEAIRQVERWRSHAQARTLRCRSVGLVNTSRTHTEFSLFDLQTATCNFSNSFIIGQDSYGCVYKGEILDRNVAIKKLHPLDMEGTSEFQQEVEVLSKVKHPYLVKLIGTCPEAWSLVYEYLPNRSVQDHLFGRTYPPLTWKIRTRIIADTSNALLYLHSSGTEKIIHGDLKPENILLDSDFNCKIAHYGICRLVPKKSARCPSFRGMTEKKSAFPYIDPELHSPDDITPKSDIYSFGVIILQLLTGRSPVELADIVRRAVLSGNLMSILDQSAGEWPSFVAKRLIDLGLQFCELKSCDRPEMRPALVKELQKLYHTEEQYVPSFFLCPILQEVMHDPHIAADGFTYEGEALRDWLNNGRQTSPMTNLSLTHSHLTPNHALRLSIRDWLCQS
ncbi:hypothetical protein ACHQM5_021355 [Ranunculus cassubicifolius]